MSTPSHVAVDGETAPSTLFESQEERRRDDVFDLLLPLPRSILTPLVTLR
jgi:hypothetical protein